MGTNGFLKLSVPVKFGRSKILMKDVCIANYENWQKQHFTTIETAYKSSPYYDYYIHEFDFVFTKKRKFLLDLNLEILDKSLELLKLQVEYSLTKSFIHHVQNANDYRYKIHPKPNKNICDDNSIYKPYWQVFDYKYQFIPNLSILDVFFNLGLDSLSYLRSCISSVGTSDNTKLV